MKKKRLIIALAIAGLVLMLLVAGYVNKRKAGGHPTSPGTYQSGEWKYVYVVQLEGTRSETRIGSLYQNGALVTGTVGETRRTPVGVFALFPSTGYNQGWLNTRTYDRRVFGPDGKLLPELKGLQDYGASEGA